MVELSTFKNLNIYDTEGKYVGQIIEVVLNIKKGRVSFFKTQLSGETNRNIGLRDVLRNSMRFLPEDEEVPLSGSSIVDIPYEIISAVGDIIIIDKEKFVQYNEQRDKKLKEAEKQKKSAKRRKVAKTN